ncbi:MAG: PAS domain S-box protein, partial [Betaproteobacteria bacterium]
METDGTRRGRNPLQRMFVFLPGSGRLLQIIWPFLVIVLLLLLLANESMHILSAARAYSEGESLWSKGQKRAMFHLVRYSETHSEDDYRKYLEAISVPLGDEKARVEMEKPDPNYPAVWQGFVEGRNHPDDIPGLIMLFRRFRRLDFMAAVIDLWAEGDRHIAELTQIADQLHARIASGRTSTDSVLPFRDRILDLDTRLTPLTDKFSSTLGEATRKTGFLLLLANLAIAGTLVPVGIYLSYRLVRRREEAERALKLSEERFNLAVTGSNDGLWDWNIDTGEVYYSPRFKELLGYTEREMGDNVEAFNSRLHPEDKPAHEQAIDGHLQRGGPFDIEMRMQTKAGEYRWFHFRGQALRTAAGRAMRMAGAMTDTTDRRLTAAELFAEKERAQVTLASIADGVITTGTDGWVEYLNPVAEALTGWTTASARGLPLRGIVNTVDETTRKITPNPIEMVLREERTIEVSAT